MKVGKEVLKLVVDCIDLEKLVIGLVEGVGEKALMEVVKKTATPIDDAVLAVLLPTINPTIEALIKEKVAELKKIIEA
jgi:hypothetical protein